MSLTIKKYLAYVLIAASVAGAFGYLVQTIRQQAAEKADLQAAVSTYSNIIAEQEKARIRATSALSSRLAASERTAAANKEALNALNQAIATDSDWAGRPLPPAVADWLRKPAAKR